MAKTGMILRYWMAANGLVVLMGSVVESLQMTNRPMNTMMTMMSASSNQYSSCGSGFTSHSCKVKATRKSSRKTASNRGSNSLVMYEPNNPRDEEDVASVWSALATTENWISATLSSPASSKNNPYSRKEVSYVCETSKDTTSIVAGVFRRVREARELGENHAHDCVAEDKKSTLRQTQVVVIPWSPELDDYHTFHNTLEAINRARRNARDLYMQKKNEDDLDSPASNWSVSINAAGLHPRFGAKTAEEALRDLQEEEELGEIDINLKAYKERRNKARQSPFPTIVIEVRATPPIDFGPGAPPTQSKEQKQEQPATSKQDLERLEALFGLSAATDHPITSKEGNGDGDFYDSIGKAFGIQEITMESPENLARRWIQETDPFYVPEKSDFHSCDTKHVDAAYEFVFSTLAMMEKERSYLIMPNFVPTSATSLDKFAMEVEKILKTIPSFSSSTVKLSTFHPEHISRKQRCDVPVIVLEKND